MKQQTIRGGFTDEGSIHSNHLRNLLADAAQTLRILRHGRKPRISYTLIHTRLPQAFGAYVKRGKCCTLGVLCKKADAIGKYWFNSKSTFNGSPQWEKLSEKFDVMSEELDRVVTCPVRGCYNYEDLLLQMAHLNDKHKWKNSRIGKWLKKEFKL